MAKAKRKNTTDDLSDDEVTPRAKPRPRKKQAVTKTSNAAVKALIRKNAATSPLLLLPSEIRENILIHLLGDNLIHVKYLDVNAIQAATYAKNQHLRINVTQGNGSEQSPPHVANASSDNDDEDDDGVGSPFPYIATALAKGEIYRPTFRHAICVANQSEQSAYNAVVSGDTDVPEGESREHYVPSCKERHAACKTCAGGPMYLLEEDLQALRVDLKVLGVCRQLYEEGNHLLWATNTFSFDDPRTFSKFFGSLNPAQKRNLTRLHISANIGGLGTYYQTAYQRARYDSNYWGTGLKISNLNMLRGVQALHLTLHQGFDYVYRRFDTNSAEKEMEAAQEADMEIILRLRALSVKHVTVIVSDDAGKLKEWNLSPLRWTAVKKTEFAENIRAQLMHPDGAELVKAEAEAANLVRKTEIRDNAAASLETCKSILKEKRADAIRTSKWASREEAKAVSAAKAATQISSKSWKKGNELQKAADEQKDNAVAARASANTRVAKENLWREAVKTAREKLKRAMARLGATPEEIEEHESVQSEDEESMVSQVKEEPLDEDDGIYSFWVQQSKQQPANQYF